MGFCSAQTLGVKTRRAGTGRTMARITTRSRGWRVCGAKPAPPVAAVEPWRGCVRRASVPSLTQTRQRGQRSLAKARQLLRNKSSVIRRKLIPWAVSRSRSCRACLGSGAGRAMARITTRSRGWRVCGAKPAPPPRSSCRALARLRQARLGPEPDANSAARPTQPR